MARESESAAAWGAVRVLETARGSALVTAAVRVLVMGQGLGAATERWSDSHWGAAMAEESAQGRATATALVTAFA